MGSPDHGSVAPSRRAVLGGAAALGATAALPAWPAAEKSPPGQAGCARFRVSLSVSPFTEAVVGAVPLTDGRRRASTVQEVQRLFSRHGATEVFVRVATLAQASSGDAEYGFVRAIERARLAANLGMALNPEQLGQPHGRRVPRDGHRHVRPDGGVMAHRGHRWPLTAEMCLAMYAGSCCCSRCCGPGHATRWA